MSDERETPEPTEKKRANDKETGHTNRMSVVVALPTVHALPKPADVDGSILRACRAIQQIERAFGHLESETVNEILSELQELVLDLCGVPEDNSHEVEWDDDGRFARDAWHAELDNFLKPGATESDFRRMIARIRKL